MVDADGVQVLVDDRTKVSLRVAEAKVDLRALELAHVGVARALASGLESEP